MIFRRFVEIRVPTKLFITEVACDETGRNLFHAHRILRIYAS